MKQHKPHRLNSVSGVASDMYATSTLYSRYGPSKTDSKKSDFSFSTLWKDVTWTVGPPDQRTAGIFKTCAKTDPKSVQNACSATLKMVAKSGRIRRTRTNLLYCHHELCLHLAVLPEAAIASISQKYRWISWCGAELLWLCSLSHCSGQAVSAS